MFELPCSCQSARPLGLRHPGHDFGDGGGDDDDGDSHDDTVDDDDLDMHPEPGHDSVASTQTSLCKLGLGGRGGNMRLASTWVELWEMPSTSAQADCS